MSPLLSMADAKNAYHRQAKEAAAESIKLSRAQLKKDTHKKVKKKPRHTKGQTEFIFLLPLRAPLLHHRERRPLFTRHSHSSSLIRSATRSELLPVGAVLLAEEEVEVVLQDVPRLFVVVVVV